MIIEVDDLVATNVAYKAEFGLSYQGTVVEVHKTQRERLILFTDRNRPKVQHFLNEKWLVARRPVQAAKRRN